jgi:hypothetical protein
VLLAAPAGALVDRVRNRELLVAALAVQAAAVLLATAGCTGTPAPPAPPATSTARSRAQLRQQRRFEQAARHRARQLAASHRRRP